MDQPWKDLWQDYYEVLGLPEAFTQEQLKSAYRRRAQQWHPDLHPGAQEEATRRFQVLQDAYRVFSSPRLFEAYLRDHREAKVPDCTFPACGRKAMETCDSCGQPACAIHLHPAGETGGRFTQPGRYCRSCVPHCSSCGAPTPRPTPGNLRGVESLRRIREPGGRWCPDCLREARVLSCSGCGSGGHSLRTLGDCPICGKTNLGFCCLNSNGVDGGDECSVCARTSLVRGLRDLILRRRCVLDYGVVLGVLLLFALFVVWGESTYWASALGDERGVCAALGGGLLLLFPLVGIGFVASRIIFEVAILVVMLLFELCDSCLALAEARIREEGYRGIA